MAEYPVSAYESAPVAFSAAVGDWANSCPAWEVNKTTAPSVPTYAYEFNDRNAPQSYLPSVSFPYGAFHTAELRYLFGLPTAPRPKTLTAEQESLATTMQRHWVSFATDGNPAVEGETNWPRFTGANQKWMSLETPATRVQDTFVADHRCGFWANLN
jgi:para-nitrobenzyl esterase